MEKPSSKHKGGWLYAEPPDKPQLVDDLVGKWLVYLSRDHVDVLWAAVSTEVTEGRLGVSAKVSTGSDTPLARDASSHVVIVYCADWRDIAEVRTALARLRELGVAQRLAFKRDSSCTAEGQPRAFRSRSGSTRQMVCTRPSMRTTGISSA